MLRCPNAVSFRRTEHGGHNPTYPTALSQKFLAYFFDSTPSWTTSTTALIARTSSSTYAEGPETFSVCSHGVRRMRAIMGSMAVSSSRRRERRHDEMTLWRYLSVDEHKRRREEKEKDADEMKMVRSLSNET